MVWRTQLALYDSRLPTRIDSAILLVEGMHLPSQVSKAADYRFEGEKGLGVHTNSAGKRRKLLECLSSEGNSLAV